MKIFKIFALAAMMFGMVACDNTTTPEEVVDMDAPTAYVGTVSVVVGGQTVPTPDSLIEIVPSQDGKSFSIVFKKIKCGGGFYQKVLLPVSKASYGIYLLHLLILVPISGAMREWLGIGVDGCLGIWTTPVEIVLAAVAGFVGSTIVAVVLQKIPKIGKYIIG